VEAYSQIFNAPPLNAGQSVSQSDQLSLPSTLAPGTYVTYVVLDNYDEAGQGTNTGNDLSEASNSVTVSGAVVAPVITSATQTDNNAITIRWTGVLSTGFYLIQRATGSSGSYVSLPAVAAGQTSFVDNNLNVTEPTTTFYYRIFSIVNGIQSAPSTVVQATFISDTTQQTTNPATTPSVAIPSNNVAQVYEWHGMDLDPCDRLKHD
jgi:hypothetical protein